ncbi:unnamed protein product [Phytomonas sp. Hart1]|nr:unnamed protein product [Phytomonas sp. Hart1]|eukprot:CCW66903.1 unnamed protein product [Phytomonas sp. isolate Hart1]
MLQAQQDVDGLPWEVRWRKFFIPTPEEILQEIRDRFELYVQDPIEREREWYLHWKDRLFKAQKDRLIWPQGFTDYLDHYDVQGRRRVLPSDQRWSDTSWKHLADVRYRDRMWMIEGEERKVIHQGMQSEQVLLAEEEQRQGELGDVFHGMAAGVIDFDPEQTYQALSGTADPLEVAKTKLKLNAYGAKIALESGKPIDPARLDPISGFPRAEMEPLASGLTVEQGAALAFEANLQQEVLEQGSEIARLSGRDPTLTMMKSGLRTSRQHNDQPMLRARIEARMEEVKMLNEEARRSGLEEGGVPSRSISSLTNLIGKLEDGVVEEEKLLSDSKSPLNANTSAAKEVFSPTEAGFIEIPRRPENVEPNVAEDLYRTPESEDLEAMPEWYRTSLVETDPLIKSYGMVNDPLEMKETKVAYYKQPPLHLEDRITNDDAIIGVSAFDEYKLYRLQSLPELVEGYKSLPLFHEVAMDCPQKVASDDAKAASAGKGKKDLKRSEKLRQERKERLRKAKLQYDPDILLPTLPWETDSIVDPYRGVEEEDAVEFNKEDLEKTWFAYRGAFQQAIMEFGNLTQVTTEDRCEQMLFDTMERFRSGRIEGHPEIPPEAKEIFSLIFEAHTKHFLADFYRIRGNRLSEANIVKSEADAMLKKVSAKCKLLGRNFMNFVQEMTSLELDNVRKNPIQRYALMLKDKKYEPLAKPFMRWVQNELQEFIHMGFQSMDQLETHREFLTKHVNDAKLQCPARVEGLSDASRDAAVEAVFLWCRGAIAFYAGKQLFRMFIAFADTRLRSRAESHFEDSIEWFTNYAKMGQGVVQIPIPDADPPCQYEEKEFLDGESAVFAELSGNFDKAEGIWHSGSTRRWYPVIDETEYMWFNERRGRLSVALDVSDRCLESMNKKTHPSIHPFPERARVFLEGAPLTQETAEHLWLRHMGDLYWEHSEFMTRQGRFQTGRAYREKCLNFYHVAMRTAQERLPASWRAPLLTQAKYLLRGYEPGKAVEGHLQALEEVVERLFREMGRLHWVEPFSDLPFRVALVQANLPAYGELITREGIRRLGWQPSNEMLMKNMSIRARGGGTMPELEKYFATTNDVAEEVFRRKVLRWRAKEREGSDAYLFWTHLYFAFRVYPKDPAEVQKLWDLFEPAFLYIYTQCALAIPQRGQCLINDALRRLCQILLPGDSAQKTTLLKELTKVREKMVHFVDRRELDRAINALDANLIDPTKPTYIYGTGLLHQDMVYHEGISRNPALRSQLASEDYAELRRRQELIRTNSTALDPHQIAQIQEGKTSSSEEPMIS